MLDFCTDAQYKNENIGSKIINDLLGRSPLKSAHSINSKIIKIPTCQKEWKKNYVSIIWLMRVQCTIELN